MPSNVQGAVVCAMSNDGSRGQVPASMDGQQRRVDGADVDVIAVETSDHHHPHRRHDDDDDDDDIEADGHDDIVDTAAPGTMTTQATQPVCHPHADTAISDASVCSDGLLHENTHRERLRRALRERREKLHASQSQTPVLHSTTLTTPGRQVDAETELMPSVLRDERLVLATGTDACHYDDGDDGAADATAADDDDDEDGGGGDDDADTDEDTDQHRHHHNIGHSYDDRALDGRSTGGGCGYDLDGDTAAPLGSGDVGRIDDDQDSVTIFGTLPPELVDRVFGVLHPDELYIAAQTCADFAR